MKSKYINGIIIKDLLTRLVSWNLNLNFFAKILVKNIA